MKTQLQGIRCNCGFALDDVVRSGRLNPDSAVGTYAGDGVCYERFAPLFDGIVGGYHGLTEWVHRSDFDPAHLHHLGTSLANEPRIRSTRIRVARNLRGMAFPPAITRDDRLRVEARIVAALGTLSGDLAGSYTPLSALGDDERRRLVEAHLLFKQGDRFLEAAGCNRDWPEGRGIYRSADDGFMVWVNEEDTMRIIAMAPGGDIVGTFTRLSRAVSALEERLDFAIDERLGYLSSCPTNLGTAMRASVHVELPGLAAAADGVEQAAAVGLSLRGVHGEHSAAEGGVVDLSNKRRLGVTEAECVSTLVKGVFELLERESKVVNS